MARRFVFSAKKKFQLNYCRTFFSYYTLQLCAISSYFLGFRCTGKKTNAGKGKINRFSLNPFLHLKKMCDFNLFTD